MNKRRALVGVMDAQLLSSNGDHCEKRKREKEKRDQKLRKSLFLDQSEHLSFRSTIKVSILDLRSWGENLWGSISSSWSHISMWITWSNLARGPIMPVAVVSSLIKASAAPKITHLPSKLMWTKGSWVKC